MQYNFIDNTVKRTIGTCNYNQHIRTAHPDRIMREHDLVYIREGCWSISQDDIDYELVPGDVILLQAGHHHYGMKPCDAAVNTCFVHFSTHVNDNVGDFRADTPGLWSFPVVVRCKNNPMTEHCFNRIIHTYWSEDEYAKQKASAYLDLLLCEIAEAGKIKHSRHPLVDEMILEVKKTPDRFISIREFAEKYHCSERTISSKFKESTGCSLHAWQIKLKCQMAEELLRYDSSFTLREIAATYGFYDEYHFGKCYKRVMGHSPKRIR